VSNKANNSAMVFIRRLNGDGYPDLKINRDPAAKNINGDLLKSDLLQNNVFTAVELALKDSGLDAKRSESPEWNPFGVLVGRGGKVFVLCNFVYHRRKGREKRQDFLAKCTHASVLLPALIYACKAVGPDGSVKFGNAPVQGANWSSLIKETGTEDLLDLLKARNIKPMPEAIDLRSNENESETSYKIVDLDDNSLLEGAGGNREYRVLQYDGAVTANYHLNGSHKYIINKEVLESDLIISVPKLKTHMKVGITCAIKGCVGAISRKECLAHHRRGTPREGGDEFERHSIIGNIIRWLGEWAWKPNGSGIRYAGRWGQRALGFIARYTTGTVTGGNWPGNDTCWRMAVDVARCLRYCDKEGNLTDTQQREHWIVVDGIVGGEGEGPLSPTAKSSRCIIVAQEPFAADIAAASVMGFDPQKIPLLMGAQNLKQYPLTSLNQKDIYMTIDGRIRPPDDINEIINMRFRAPKTWRGHVESS
jgi:hypothetical protein